MSQTISQLTVDVLPRLTAVQKKGISIYQAANSILSLLYKRLVDRGSDLLASGDLDLIIPAYGYTATLPDDFVSMAEKPKSTELYTDWMAGTVTSYDSVTGVLVINSTNSSGTDSLSDWKIALAEIPGSSSTIVGESTTTLTPTTGTVTLTITTGLSLVAGNYVFIIPSDLPDTYNLFEKVIQPTYLLEDQEHDYTWWTSYGLMSLRYEPPYNQPTYYKIIGSTFYVRPKVIQSVSITGKYNQQPTPFASPDDVIPWKGLFYEVFREGVVRIMTKQIAIPDADADFMLFFDREVNIIVNSRYRVLPKYRMKREYWL
jgi:hypothetical protein